MDEHPMRGGGHGERSFKRPRVSCETHTTHATRAHIRHRARTHTAHAPHRARAAHAPHDNKRTTARMVSMPTVALRTASQSRRRRRLLSECPRARTHRRLRGAGGRFEAAPSTAAAAAVPHGGGADTDGMAALAAAVEAAAAQDHRDHDDGRLRVADFFCGAGGMSEGFRQAGCLPVAGFDRNEDALETFRRNLRCPAYNVDLFDEKGRAAAVALARELRVDVVVGGPPCQGFSNCNLYSAGHKYMGTSRSLNTLPTQYARMVRAIAPKLVVMEEVRPFMTSQECQDVRAELEPDYHVECAVLCAADYGVPQKRNRCILVGLRRDLLAAARAPPPLHPPPTHAGRHVTVREALKLGRPAPGAAITHERLLRLCAERRAMEARNEEAEQWKHIYTCVDLDQPANTITTCAQKPSSGRFTFYRDGTFHRMSVDEAACLQSFPRDYAFAGGVTSRYVQVGNAVPPRLARALAEHLGAVLASASAAPSVV
jgi:DNA (cytosine-5)-methyltransferase 1